MSLKWLQAVADKHGFPHGIVCNTDLADPNAESTLKAQKQFPNLRGVRQMLYWDTETVRQGAARPDFCNDPNFRRGFALLEKHDLHFELQVYAGQAAYAVELIEAFPNVRMILVHAGMLTARTPAAIDQWRGALTAMAAFPNLHVKISGLGMYSSGVTVSQVRQVIRDVIQIFGVERTIYGSNFPLEKLHASYKDFLGAYRTVLSEYTEAEQRAVLHDNAVKSTFIVFRCRPREGGDHTPCPLDKLRIWVRPSRCSAGTKKLKNRSPCRADHIRLPDRS